MIFQIFQIIITIVTLSLVIFILRIIKNQRFFKNHGVPHETPAPIFGNMLSIITKKESLSDVIKKLYDTHSNAKYIGFYDFTNPVIILRDLELIKLVAIKNFDNFSDHGLMGPKPNDRLFARNLFNLKGQEWHRVRCLLSPAFTPWKMKTMFNLISNSAVNFVDYLYNDANDKNCMREMKEAFSRCTNDVIINCAFGITINTMENPNNDFYILGKEATNFARLYLKVMLMRTFPVLMKILGVKMLRRRVDEFFNESIRCTINNRDRLKITRPDILQLLMDSRGGNTKIDLSMEEITAQAFVIYFGAFDTTSTIMSFMAHELAMNSEIQERLQNEIDNVFYKTDNPSYDEIMELEYLEAVIYETVRKYPSMASLDRICTREFQLPAAVPGAKPVLIKPGMMIWIPVVGFHYDPNFYQNPETFNPDRFFKNNSISNKDTFLTFGIGPRQCLGSRFAILEMKIVFFHLLSRFTIRVCPKTNVPLTMSCKSLGFGAKGGYWLKLERRVNFVSKYSSKS